MQALITIWAASTFLGPVRLAAGMAVTDELLFKEGVQFVDDEVMDNSVPEIRREDFALYRLVDDERDGSARLIGAVVDFFAQCYQVAFIIDFEGKRAGGASLMLAAGYVRAEQLVDRNWSAVLFVREEAQ